MDAISGKQAVAYAKIDGRVEELFYAKSLEANIEKNKIDVPILGKTNTGKRAAGWTGSGSMTIYYVTSLFRQMMIDYVKTGKDNWFDLVVENEDPSSDAGKQSILLKDCNMDSIVIAKFDATSDDMLDEEIPFTFSDVDMLDQFNTITGV
ncbi:phage tail tube protein [Paenibacillus algorifonticola]|nr:phage tail tube protein [Paenibacillus algorifonticola]